MGVPNPSISSTATAPAVPVRSILPTALSPSGLISRIVPAPRAAYNLLLEKTAFHTAPRFPLALRSGPRRRGGPAHRRPSPGAAGPNHHRPFRNRAPTARSRNRGRPPAMSDAAAHDATGTLLAQGTTDRLRRPKPTRLMAVSVIEHAERARFEPAVLHPVPAPSAAAFERSARQMRAAKPIVPFAKTATMDDRPSPPPPLPSLVHPRGQWLHADSAEASI